jgi:hypothetical protein
VAVWEDLASRPGPQRLATQGWAVYHVESSHSHGQHSDSCAPSRTARPPWATALCTTLNFKMELPPSSRPVYSATDTAIVYVTMDVDASGV